MHRVCCALAILGALPGWLYGQAPTSNNPSTTDQGPVILQQTLAALTAGPPITDVTLRGSVTVTLSNVSSPGPGVSTVPQITTKSAAITLIAVGDGQSELAFTWPSGGSTDLRSSIGGVPAEITTGSNGTVRHPVTDGPVPALTPHAAWFFPAFSIAAECGSTYTGSYIGDEIRNGAAVKHLEVWQLPSDASLDPAALKHFTRHDLYIDPSSFLPIAAVFNARVYPADPKLRPVLPQILTVPQEIRYSDYRLVQGWLVPFHLEVFINNSPYMDIQISGAALNKGLSLPSVN